VEAGDHLITQIPFSFNQSVVQRLYGVGHYLFVEYNRTDTTRT
jgi:hypothetical protein